MSCLHCGATTSNGLALCELCRRKAETDLEFVPIYFRNLARWRRPARPNGSLGGRGTWLIKRGEVSGSMIDHALDLCGNALSTWARALHDDRFGFNVPEQGDDEAATVADLCLSLSVNLTSIATLEWAGEFVREIGEHEATLRALTETSVPGWYAGLCKRDIAGTACGAPTHVVPGLTWVTCAQCGSTTYARDHIDTVLDEARGWIAPPKRLAEAIVALVDTEASVERLRKRITNWGNREQLEVVRRRDADGDPTGPRCYQFGETFDRLMAEGATKAEDEGMMSA